MVTAPCELAHVLLTPMVQRRFGRIINVASLAGMVPGSAGHTLYGAAKAFMIKFSQSLLLENRKANVLTTALCPGFTYTEFHDVTGTRAQVSRYGKHWWSSAEDVAAAGYAGVMAGRSIVITGRRSKQIAALMKVLPDTVALGMVERQTKTFRAK
jgi:short-subunit dehydrogenase